MTEQQQLGAPKLTVIDAIAQSLAIGPVLSAGLLATLVASAAGSAAPLAALLGAIGSICVGFAIIFYAQRFTGAGAIYDYVRRGGGALLGTVSAGIYFLGAMFLGGAGIYLAIGFFAQMAAQAYLGINLPWWLWALVCVGAVFAFNHFGVQTTTRTQLVLTAVAVLPILILAFAIIFAGGAAGNTLEVFNPTGANVGNLFQGVLFAITLFIGFEASASLSEETANPKRTIPVAVIGTVVIAAVFYVLVLYASAIGFGVDKVGDWAKDPSPLSTLGTKYVGAWIAPWLDLALIVDMLAVASAFTATAARGWFALARDGLLPSVLGSISSYKTPLGGNLLVAGLAVLFVLVTVLSGTAPMDMFVSSATAGTLLITLIYIVLGVLAFKVLGGNSPIWQYLVLPFAIITPIFAIYGSIVPFPPAGSPPFVGAMLTLGAIVVAVLWTVLNLGKINSQSNKVA
jgi:amino acid transporter